MINGTALPLFNELVRISALPRTIEFAYAGRGVFATVYNYLSGLTISRSACTGYSSEPDAALFKALTEFVERRAYSEALAKKESWALSSSTDGFAAFPIVDQSVDQAEAKARLHALQEAIERFSWATWWDSPDIGFKIQAQWQPSDSSDHAGGLSSEIEKRLPVAEYYLIEPKIANSPFTTVIIFAKLKGGGFISGGACELSCSKKNAHVRAMAELTRHALALLKLKKLSLSPATFYEQRLQFFGTGFGDKIVRSRLAKKGSQAIELPKLIVNIAVDHTMSRFVSVHRCLFEGQPAFVGGELERLCL